MGATPDVGLTTYLEWLHEKESFTFVRVISRMPKTSRTRIRLTFVQITSRERFTGAMMIHTEEYFTFAQRYV